MPSFFIVILTYWFYTHDRGRYLFVVFNEQFLFSLFSIFCIFFSFEISCYFTSLKIFKYSLSFIFLFNKEFFCIWTFLFICFLWKTFIYFFFKFFECQKDFFKDKEILTVRDFYFLFFKFWNLIFTFFTFFRKNLISQSPISKFFLICENWRTLGAVFDDQYIFQIILKIDIWREKNPRCKPPRFELETHRLATYVLIISPRNLLFRSKLFNQIKYRY